MEPGVRGRAIRVQQGATPMKSAGSKNGRGKPQKDRQREREGANHHRTPSLLPTDPYEVRLARPSDRMHLARICHLLQEAREAGSIIAVHDEEFLETGLRERRAVLALRGELVVGFGIAHAWQQDQFVSHTALVVSPQFRGRGLGRRMKDLLIQLSRRRWPKAAVMSLTLSPRMERLNKAFRYEAVPYCDLTTDLSFWKSCEGCVHHGHLKRNQYQDCHCWAGLLLPIGKIREKVIPKDALTQDEDSLTLRE